MADADREDEGAAPLDEDAAWAALVAGYDAEPEPGTEPSWPESENVPADADTATAPPAPPAPPPSRTIVVHPVISGPRNYELVDDEEDAHFVPPEPPPLPESDLTTKFAWIGVIGGPLLLLGFVLFQLELTWWAMVLGGGGFLGGFATLFARMRTDEDDEDLPGGGAVV